MLLYFQLLIEGSLQKLLPPKRQKLFTGKSDYVTHFGVTRSDIKSTYSGAYILPRLCTAQRGGGTKEEKAFFSSIPPPHRIKL